MGGWDGCRREDLRRPEGDERELGFLQVRHTTTSDNNYLLLVATPAAGALGGGGRGEERRDRERMHLTERPDLNGEGRRACES